MRQWPRNFPLAEKGKLRSVARRPAHPASWVEYAECKEGRAADRIHHWMIKNRRQLFRAPAATLEGMVYSLPEIVVRVTIEDPFRLAVNVTFSTRSPFANFESSSPIA